MTLRHLRTLLITTCLIAIACGGDDEPRSSYQGSCRNACTAANKCSSTVNIDDCSSTCEADYADEGPNLNPAYLAELDACVTAATCAALAINTRFGVCDAEARAVIAASDTVSAFCDRVIAEDQQCSRVQRGYVCPDFMKVYSDEALSRALPCFDQSCDLQEDCVDGELGSNFGGNNP